jgi:hypothetical protein
MINNDVPKGHYIRPEESIHIAPREVRYRFFDLDRRPREGKPRAETEKHDKGAGDGGREGGMKQRLDSEKEHTTYTYIYYTYL